MKRAAIALLFSLIAVNLASAGIIRAGRHVVRSGAKATGHVVAKTAKAVKTVAY